MRQKLHRLAKENDWAKKHNITIGSPQELPGDYSKLLSSSVFCLVLPGQDILEHPNRATGNSVSRALLTSLYFKVWDSNCQAKKF